MKKIVTVKRDVDGRTRIYEVTEDIAAGTSVLFSFRGQAHTGVATQNSIEVTDEIVEFFTNKPLVLATTLADAEEDE